MSSLFHGSAVVYDKENFIQRQMAYTLKVAFSKATGEEVRFDEEADAGSPRILLQDDSSLPRGGWSVAVSGNTVTCSASTYYGYLAIAKYLKTDEAADLLSLRHGFAAEGSYLDSLSELEESDRYAYDKKGEIRTMFYNVLFYNPAPSLRNVLNRETVKQYMPDVLGCQEFNRSKRDRAKDRDLAKLLAEIGYQETVNPWVHNADTVENGGYGIDNIEEVTVNGKTFYSDSNNTPLFYNIATTRCIASEYYWYRHQIDDENRNNCSNRDCASKALTWGVFETIATGKRYIVVSTHMCTRSNGVKGLQAIEAVELFNRLQAEYRCPIIIGGDYNAVWSQPNYVHFTSPEVGYVDIGRNGVATLHSSEARTYHRPYPVFHEDLHMVLPDENDDAAIDLAGGVDHIVLANGESVKVNVYGVVVDEVATAGSDHYPIFADMDL
ncbi:MAG: endonuclease/exonuclease/phosphatase family protein [Clostridia bacterium]|nr:endonuclease/exonuclease/phosphatase family protein [Clostridia bacterium]